MTWIEFFSTRLSHIFLVYGLAFFILGVAVALEIGRAEPTRFSRAMWPLAFFGLVHGTHEWLEMFTIIGKDAYNFQPTTWFEIFRLILLAVSFIALITFGVQIIQLSRHLRYPALVSGVGFNGGNEDKHTPSPPPGVEAQPVSLATRTSLVIGVGILLLYTFGVVMLGRWLHWQQPAWFAAADALARYCLAIPGAVVASWALITQRDILLRSRQSAFTNNLLWVAIAFLLYGVIGQFFINPSPLFPSNVINAETFQSWFGIPVQLFRAAMATIAAIFTIRALRAFEYNRQQALLAARRRVEEEIAHRDAQRQEFLQRIVETQEDERTRIARELHDELGQVLTGLALGLRAARTSLDNPDLLQQQLAQLEEMAVQGLDDMRHMVNELRPALLDDMGLSAALRQYVDNFAILTDIETDLALCKTCDNLQNSIKMTLFRVTQESLTNIARHAQATQAWVDMSCDHHQVTLQIKDNGVGFNPTEILGGEKHTAWGLMGIQERAKLVDGDIQILSEANKGTTISITVPKK